MRVVPTPNRAACGTTNNGEGTLSYPIILQQRVVTTSSAFRRLFCLKCAQLYVLSHSPLTFGRLQGSAASNIEGWLNYESYLWL